MQGHLQQRETSQTAFDSSAQLDHLLELSPSATFFECDSPVQIDHGQPPLAANSLAYLERDRATLTEESLVIAAQAGQQWAIAEIFLRNRGIALRCVYRVTHNLEDAEDAIQDAMMRAYLNLNKFDRRAKFSTWFTRIAINSSLMILRKRSRWTHVSLDAHSEDNGTRPLDVADCAMNPEECFITSEAESHLVECPIFCADG